MLPRIGIENKIRKYKNRRKINIRSFDVCTTIKFKCIMMNIIKVLKKNNAKIIKRICLKL